jgi:hypothetical protein
LLREKKKAAGNSLSIHNKQTIRFLIHKAVPLSKVLLLAKPESKPQNKGIQNPNSKD